MTQKKVLNPLQHSCMALAYASEGNPLRAVLTIFCFFLIFTLIEAGIETLVYGKHFLHWLDIFFLLGLFYYGLNVVKACTAYQIIERKP